MFLPAIEEKLEEERKKNLPQHENRLYIPVVIPEKKDSTPAPEQQETVIHIQLI